MLFYIFCQNIFLWEEKKYAAGFTLSGKCCVPEAKTCSPCPPLLTPEHDTVEYSFCGLEFTKYIRLLSYHNCEISSRDSITRKCVSYSYKSTLRIFGYAINIRCQQLFFTDYKLAIRDSFFSEQVFYLRSLSLLSVGRLPGSQHGGCWRGGLERTKQLQRP